MSTRELQQQLLENLRQWQKIENATITLTGGVLEQTRHPLLSILMEIIQRDSQMHHRVQQMIIDSLESTVLELSPADVGEIWRKLESHAAMELETVRLAHESLEALAGQGLTVQELLFNYLRLEEEKHTFMLEQIAALTQEDSAEG